MSRPIIPFSTLDTPALLTLHNTLAQQCGEKTKKSWHDSRCRLVERVAILRTLPAKKALAAKPAVKKLRKKVKREQPIRQAILAALAIVSHYEERVTGARVNVKDVRSAKHRHKLVSVGLHYADVLAIVRKKFPGASSGADLRWHQFHARNEALQKAKRRGDEKRAYGSFDGFTMPHKRPHTGKAKS